MSSPCFRLARTGRRQGGFEVGIQRATERLLIDPKFLYRFEREARHGDTAFHGRVSDIELASRLSFFLWSSIPDQELLTLAEKGRLSDETILTQQVRRMLKDKRSASLVNNFGAQWLYLRNLKIVEPNPSYFPDFEQNVRLDLETETELLLGDQIKRDRPVGELLTADYTFLNETLARFYGVPGVYGDHFRRVQLSDPNRRGCWVRPAS